MMTSRRQREKARSRRLWIQQQFAELYSGLFPADIFGYTVDGFERGTEVVFICRVSSDGQRANLPAQIHDGVQRIVGAGHHVVGIHSFVANGADPNYHRQLVDTMASYDTPIMVAEHYDRFVRAPDFGRHHPFAEPSSDQLERLRDQFHEGNVLPAVIHPCDADITSLRARRGKRLHGRRQVDYRRRRREMLLPIARSMHQCGLSIGSIARNLALPKGTVGYYLSGG